MNLTDKHRLTVHVSLQKVNSNPDIVNNGYPSFPDLPVTSSQYSFRLHRHGLAALDAVAEPGQRGGWGTIWSPVYFSANITPDRLLRRLQR